MHDRSSMDYNEQNNFKQFLHNKKLSKTVN